MYELFLRSRLNLLQNVKSIYDVTLIVNLSSSLRSIFSLSPVTMDPHRFLKKLKIAS